MAEKEPVKWETKGWSEKESEKSRVEYSRTSCKRPPKISSLGAGFREVRPQVLSILGDLHLVILVLYSIVLSLFREPLPVGATVRFTSAVMIWVVCYNGTSFLNFRPGEIQKTYVSSGRLQEVKNNRKFQTAISKN